MKSINLKYIVMALLVIINTTAFGKPMLDIQRWSTKNGARVLFTEAHELPMVDIIVIFYAGSIWNGKNFGLASFTGSMLSEGTKTLTADQIADNFDQIGAQFSVGVDVDVATVSLRCLTDPDILNKSLKTFSSVLTEPSFPENEFKRVQKQILIRILQQKQEPGSVAYSEFLKSLYGDFPYGASFDQKQDVISKLTPVDLQNFYNKYYVAKNAVVVMVGDLTRQQAETVVEEIFSKLPAGDVIGPLPEILEKPKTVSTHIDFPATQTNVVMGQIGITRDDIDYFPLYVGNYILGQAPMVSELSKEIRENRGLVYHIGSGFETWLKPGPFIINFGTSNEKKQEALDVSMKVLKDFVQDGPTEGALEGAKKSLIGRFPLEFANNASICNKLARIGVYKLPLDYYDTYIDKIKSVTLKQLQEAFKRHIDLDRMTIVTVGKS